MKKLIIITSLTLLGNVAYTQVLISLVFGDKLNTGKIEFGLDGGWTMSTLSGVPGAKGRPGFDLGFYFDIKTKNPAWMVSTGVVVKGPMGAKGLPVYSLNDPALDSAFKGGSVTTKLGYFYVPITMKYTFKNHFYLKGGIQLGLINKMQDEFVNNVQEDEDLTYQLKRKGDFHPLDAGLTAGIGYRLMKGYGMNIGVNYYYGLVDAVIDDVTPKQYNRALYVNVGIPIGKGKAEKKAKAKAQEN